MMPAKEDDLLKYNHAANVRRSKTRTCICPDRKLLRRGMSARNTTNATRSQPKVVMRVRIKAVSSRNTRFASSHRCFASSGGREDQGVSGNTEGRVKLMKETSPWSIPT